jgi:hypothetical protein
MSIKIILSDLKNITPEEMADLNAYLKAVQLRVDSDSQVVVSEGVGALSFVQEPIEDKKEIKKPTRKTKTVPVVEPLEPVECVSLPPATQEVTPRTYDDLIAYVLENTRTKKLTFDKVMALVKQFDVPNINSLQEHAEKIEPFYTALENLING